MFDPVCKFLIETFPTDFANWLLGKPATLTEISPSELSLEPIRPDALMIFEAEDTILHIEAQTQTDKAIPFRMLDYRVRTHRRYPGKKMKQVVIYLRKTQSELAYQTTFTLENTQHQFEVIRLWEQPLETFLSIPGLLPFAILSQAEDKEAALTQVAEQIETLPTKKERDNITASAYILAGLVLDQSVTERILMDSIFEESVTYQAIIERGRAKGIQQGLKQAKKELIVQQLNRKLGSVSGATEVKIEQLSLEQVESLGEALLEFETAEDLSGWLADAAEQNSATQN